MFISATDLIYDSDIITRPLNDDLCDIFDQKKELQSSWFSPILISGANFPVSLKIAKCW